MASFEAEAGAMLPEAEADPRELTPGSKIDDLEILATLGRGAFGVTYLAKDHAGGSQVAVKLFQPDLALLEPLDGEDDPQQAALSAFRAEADILRRLDHPNIARLRDFRDRPERPYLTFEMEQGLNLECALAGAHRSIGEAQLRAILGPLLLALEALHDQQILHRDIKPANICLRQDGSPVLLDFGAAAAVSESLPEAATDSLVTPGYAAPEQYYEDSQEGPWTDLYSLAAVAYWMVTGRVPADALARLEGKDHPPAAEAAARRASPAFLTAIDRALELDPERRPRSARELLEALKAGDGGPTLAPAPAPAPARGPASVPAPAPVEASGEDDVLPTKRIKRQPGVPEIQPDQMQRERNLQTAPVRQRRGIPAGLVFGTLLILIAGGAGLGYWQWQLQANKTEWSVDPAGNGDVLTISEALLKAKAGSVIRIQPGTYTESLVVTQPVTLEAASPAPGATVVAPESGPCLTSSADGGGVRGLTFRKAAGGGGAACLLLVGSSMTLSDSQIESAGTPAVILRDGGGPVLENLDIVAQGGIPAIVMTSGTRARLSGSRIGASAAMGLLVRGGAAPEVIGNEIEGASRVGLMIERGATGRYEGNTVRNSGGNGVEVRSGAKPVFAKNRIEGSGEAGIFIYDAARGQFDSNIVLDNKLSGIVLADAAAPVLRKNEVRGNGGHGIVYLKSAGGRAEDNRIEANKGHGLAISLEADPELGKNEISKNGKDQTKKGVIKSE